MIMLQVASCPKNFPFTSKKRDCFKCEIFVARVYSCYKAFSLKGGIDGELLAKVKKCLEIMESRLPHPNAHSNKKRKSFEKKQVEEPPVEESPPQPPAKRKRGRPPKNVKQSPPPPEPAEEMSSSMTESAEEPFASSRLWRSARRSTGSNTKNGKKQSLTKLMARFEDQYKEMGEKYQAMGETLRELKSKIEDNRDATEKEIRNELLAEVQKTIMGGAK